MLRTQKGELTMDWALLVAQKVNLRPDPGELPGGNVLQDLTNGIAGFALVFCLVGLVVGAGLWALGSNSNNYQQTFAGKRAVAVSLLSAGLIGGAATFINFFYGAGQRI